MFRNLKSQGEAFAEAPNGVIIMELEYVRDWQKEEGTGCHVSVYVSSWGKLDHLIIFQELSSREKCC